MPKIPHEPTPEEIRERCEAIQKTWDAQDEFRHRVDKSVGEVVKFCRLGSIDQ
jgi:hypothetical protein